jgi:quercetin dioxygenase-like cupin family protein
MLMPCLIKYRRLCLFAASAAALLAVGFAGPRAGLAAAQDPTRATAAGSGGCPGKEGPTQYLGKTEVRPAPRAVVNGKPMTGTWSEPGAHSYWHCHPGGQFLIVMEGVGRAQKRGERMRELKVGDIEYAGPWVEHWHGAGPDAEVQFVQVAMQPTGTRWQEKVSDADYLGNDNGVASRLANVQSLEK